ncbi:MAG: hypothetical protein RL189_776 [Pseudomonadota bacterium]
MALINNESNLLLIGDNAEKVGLVSDAIRRFFPRAKTTNCSTVRLGSPAMNLGHLTAIILLWESNPMTDWRQLFSQDKPKRRSSEGIVSDIAKTCGDKVLRRIAVLTTGLSKEEVIFLAEFNVRCIQSVSTDSNRLGDEIGQFIKKISKMIEDEENGGGNSSERAMRRFESALEKWHRFDEIQRMYLSNEVHKQFGNSANYFELMGRRAIVENNNEKAEELFQQSLSKNPNQIRAKQELADLYMNRGSIKEALRVYLELHNANPRHPERAAKIADCYFKLGQIKDADSICSQAVSLDQFSQIVRENLAVTRMAFGDYESVKNLIKTGVDANSFARQLNSIGINLVKAGRYDESIEHYKKAQDLLPNNNVQHLLLLNIGIAYAKWGKFAEAKQYAELALVEQPDYQKSYSTSEGSWSSIRKD